MDLQAEIAAELPTDVPEEIRAQFAALVAPDYWEALVPGLHVSNGRAKTAAPILFDETTLAQVNASLKEEGYFQLPPTAWPPSIATMADAVRAVVTAGHLPVLTYIYDETWMLYGALETLLRGILGEGYMMQPAFWAWHVDGSHERAGWQPHRDQDSTTLRPDRSPKALSLWIALSDATSRNGCMYILPADRDPLYQAPMSSDIQLDLQDIRALPSPAGGVLGWTHAALHWGGRASPRASSPRISLSVEFQRGDEPPFKRPLYNPTAIPSVVHRLRLILRQMLQYQHLYRISPELRRMAEAVALKRTQPGADTVGQ